MSVYHNNTIEKRMEKGDEDDRAEILSNKVFILKNVIKQPMVYPPRLLDGTYIGLATYIMESDIVSAEDKEVITDWALENFNEWRDGKWRWTVPPEDRPFDFDYSFIIDLEEEEEEREREKEWCINCGMEWSLDGSKNTHLGYLCGVCLENDCEEEDTYDRA